MEFLIEVFIEIFGEGFLYLSDAFIPDTVSETKARKVVGIIFFIIAMVLMFGVIIGIALLFETDGKSFWGWLFIALGVIYIILGIFLKIVAYKKNT